MFPRISYPMTNDRFINLEIKDESINSMLELLYGAYDRDVMTIPVDTAVLKTILLESDNKEFNNTIIKSIINQVSYKCWDKFKRINIVVLGHEKDSEQEVNDKVTIKTVSGTVVLSTLGEEILNTFKNHIYKEEETYTLIVINDFSINADLSRSRTTNLFKAISRLMDTIKQTPAMLILSRQDIDMEYMNLDGYNKPIVVPSKELLPVTLMQHTISAITTSDDSNMFDVSAYTTPSMMQYRSNQ